MYSAEKIIQIYLRLDEEAALKYAELGKIAESSDDLEAAEAYESAAKCYKMVKNYAELVRNMEMAISFLKRQNRFVKCALLYESLVDPSMAPVEDQIRFLKKAEKYYELADDKRSSPLRERLADLYGRQGRFKDAAEQYIARANDLAADPILIHAARKNFLFGQCCFALHEQSGGMKKSGFPGWFTASQESSILMAWLQYYEGEVETFQPAVKFPAWLVEASSGNKSLC